MLYEAHIRKEAREWDRTRTMIAWICNRMPTFSKEAKTIFPEEIIKLPIIDGKKPIRKEISVEEAREIFEKDKKFLKIKPNEINGKSELQR